MIRVEPPGPNRGQDIAYWLGAAAFASLGGIEKKAVEDRLQIKDPWGKKFSAYSIVFLSGGTLGGVVKFCLTQSWEGTSKGIAYGAGFFVLGGVIREVSLITGTWSVLNGIASMISGLRPSTGSAD